MFIQIHKGSNGVFGFTEDEAGEKLPSEHGPWEHERSMTIERGKKLIALNADQCIDDIERQGFHLTKPSITTTEAIISG